MSLTRPLPGRAGWMALLVLVLPHCATSEVPSMSTPTVQLSGDGPSVEVTEADARQMADALRAALADPALVAASGAPAPLRQRLQERHPPSPFSMAAQVRAGDWLLVSADTGPRWDMRMATPDAPRMGLIFQVPLIRADAKAPWRAASIRFVKAW